MAELLKGVELVRSDKSVVDAAEALNGKIVALYFSAGFCPPCHKFTPKLKRFYETVNAAGKQFEVVFVSMDRSAEAQIEYFEGHHGQWTYLAFGNPKIKELFELFGLAGPGRTIPAVRVIKADGTAAVKDARDEVEEKGVEGALELYKSWEALF